MEVTKRCVEVAALTDFRKKIENTKLEIMKPLKENEKNKENYDVSFLINDLPINIKLILLKPSKLDEVATFSGASLSIKGRFIPPEEQNNDISKDQLLCLHVVGQNKQSILLALQMLEHLIKDIAGPEESTPSCQVEKVLVGMEIAPAEFNLRGQILGADGANLHFIGQETEAEVTLRGRGSGHEEPALGKESPEPLHIRIQHHRPEVVQAGRILALHLLETVKQEFDKYCSQQAQLMVTPLPVSAKKKRTPSPKSDISWSPTTLEFTDDSDLEDSDEKLNDSDVRLKNIASSPHSKISSKGDSSVSPEVNKPKSEGKTANIYQKHDENKTRGEKESENKPDVPPGHLLKRKVRGGRKSKMYRDKIAKFVQCLEKLHEGNPSPEERKELIGTLDILKPRLTAWWGEKQFGHFNFAIQYKKIKEHYANITERHRLQEEQKLKKQKLSMSEEESNVGRLLARTSPLLPVPTSMFSSNMAPNSFRPPFQPPIPIQGARPPFAMSRPTNPSGQPAPITPRSSHTWLSNRLPRGQPNPNFGPRGKQWLPPQAAQHFNNGSGWNSNQRPHSVNSSPNDSSSSRWSTQLSPQNFHAPVSYPIPNRNFTTLRRPQNQMQPRVGIQPRWEPPPRGMVRPPNPQHHQH